MIFAFQGLLVLSSLTATLLRMMLFKSIFSVVHNRTVCFIFVFLSSSASSLNLIFYIFYFYISLQRTNFCINMNSYLLLILLTISNSPRNYPSFINPMWVFLMIEFWATLTLKVNYRPHLFYLILQLHWGHGSLKSC